MFRQFNSRQHALVTFLRFLLNQPHILPFNAVDLCLFSIFKLIFAKQITTFRVIGTSFLNWDGYIQGLLESQIRKAKDPSVNLFKLRKSRRRRAQ